MNADGSELELVTEDIVLIRSVLGSPTVSWSPDGTRLAYATSTGDLERLQIWNASPGCDVT